MVLTVPPIRKSMGWQPAEKVPSTYPSESPSLVSSDHHSPQQASQGNRRIRGQLDNLNAFNDVALNAR